MIVEIEKPRLSCRASLDYNEEKVLHGVAELVGYANMESTDREAVYALFERYERTRHPVKELSFHASVNPSATDTCSEEQILAFISALMDHLGYGSQPYLVYRHFDIEREHYHVVSVRADAEGRKINNWYEKRRASAFMREVAAQYGFSVAEKGSRVVLRESLEGEMAGDATRFNPGKPVYGQMKAIFRKALTYDHDTFPQLAAILEDYGLRASMAEDGDVDSITLQGLDRKGNPVTEPVPESILGEPLFSLASVLWSANRQSHGRRAREKGRLRSLVGFAFGISRSEGHFVNILKNKGISVHLSRTSDTGDVFGITFVDHSTRTVFKASEIRDVISVRMMREAVSSGRWRVEDRGRRRSTYVQAARESARTDAVALRDLHAGVVARILKGVGQPAGSSWSGRVALDKDRKKAKLDEEKAGVMDANFEDRRYEEKLK